MVVVRWWKYVSCRDIWFSCLSIPSCTPHCPSLFLPLCLSFVVSLRRSLFVPLCLSLFLPLCLYLFVPLCLFLYLSLRLFLYLYTSIPLCASLYLHLHFCLCVVVPFCLSFFVYLCLAILSLTPSIPLCVPCLCKPIFVSLCISLFVSKYSSVFNLITFDDQTVSGFFTRLLLTRPDQIKLDKIWLEVVRLLLLWDLIRCYQTRAVQTH